MATLNRKQSGCWSIQYDLQNGRRKTLTLPRRFDESIAKEFRAAVDDLLYYRNNGLDYRTEKKKLRTWIENADPLIREKLAAHGLIKILQRHTSKELWRAFLEQKNDVTEGTIATYENAERRFFEFFKTEDLISDLSKLQMLEWKDFLLKELAEATVAGTLAKAKAVFEWAVEKKWLEASPLDKVEKCSYRNEDNDRFVTMEEYGGLLDKAICQEWRTIIALARIGGMRAPSEVLRLKWSDVDLKAGSFYVRKLPAKSSRNRKGTRDRKVPLFPELRKELEALRDRDKGKKPEFVINRYRDPKTNLGTRITEIAKSAGVGPIPRPFDNMRASRSTEIDREYGPKAESLWIGHSAKTAFKHYLMVLEEDFARAAGLTDEGNQ